MPRLKPPVDGHRRRLLRRGLAGGVAGGVVSGLHLAGPVILSLVAVSPARAASIVAVRVWPAKAYTRVTLESDTALQASHFVTDNPPKLVVDISQMDLTDLNPAVKELVGKVRADDPFIAGVRAGQGQPRVTRLVFDLKQAVQPQLFTLAPVAQYQHRLVFDLYPVSAPDPLAALIQEKLEAERQAARAVDDALGELIGKLDKPGNKPATVSGPSSRPSSGSAGLAGTLGAGQPGGIANGANASGAGNAGLSGPVAAAPQRERTEATSSAASSDGSRSEIWQDKGQDRAQERERVREKIDRLFIVAVDPGHGGEDPGAIGPTGLREKDVVLKVALRLRDKLNRLPNVRVFLTRDDDYFVPLHERVAKARKVQADLFVSIHADAFFTPEARGASVFALSESGASSSAARWMANRENGADLVGGVNAATQDAQVLRALVEMSTAAQIKSSLKIGQEVLSRIGQVGRLHKRQVEQAGFAVLKAPDIPSILVETAFISNPDEERKLRDADFQQDLVNALAAGIERWFARQPGLPRQRTA